MTRVLRSLMLGDCDHYFSPYVHGVAQGMALLGHWHSQVSIRQPIAVIEQRIADVRPDILWTHMLLWAPAGSPPLTRLIETMAKAAKQGARVIIHDGDYKENARYPHSLSPWCSLVLCNHRHDRSVWRTQTLYWPYFALAQRWIAPPQPHLACDLFFAGTVQASQTYAARTRLLADVRKRGVDLKISDGSDGNTLLRTPEIAASAHAVLGFGRPGVTGWVDTRVFQYPGAGAILVHDDTAGYLEPGRHFLPYASGSAESVAETVDRIRAMPEAERAALRERAFLYVQTHHSSVPRVETVLRALGLQ